VQLLGVPLAEVTPPFDDASGDGTLEGLERQHIIRVLRETGGVIVGSRGAAVRLGLKRTTLQSRILKLRISRQEYEN
jgi:formate hydrogenlyase transcriptional activator